MTKGAGPVQVLLQTVADDEELQVRAIWRAAATLSQHASEQLRIVSGEVMISEQLRRLRQPRT